MKKLVILSTVILFATFSFSVVSTSLNSQKISLSNLLSVRYHASEAQKYTPIDIDQWCANGHLCVCQEHCYEGGQETCCVCIKCPCKCN